MPSARTFQVTLGAGNTDIASNPTPFSQMIVQNNAAAICRFGAFAVSASEGITLQPSGGVGSTVVIGPFAGVQADAMQFWLNGTTAQVIDVLLI